MQVKPEHNPLDNQPAGTGITIADFEVFHRWQVF
jgi:hypothetical protein